MIMGNFQDKAYFKFKQACEELGLTTKIESQRFRQIIGSKYSMTKEDSQTLLHDLKKMGYIEFDKKTKKINLKK